MLFPLTESLTATADTSEEFSGDGPDGRIRVMVVDDHTLMRVGMGQILALQPDLDVVGDAADGEAAVRAAQDLHPDVILMDISMPRLNGIEATKRIKSLMPDVKIIGLSMYEERQTRGAMRSAGASDYLSKSAGADEVCNAIRKAFRAG